MIRTTLDFVICLLKTLMEIELVREREKERERFTTLLQLLGTIQYNLHVQLMYCCHFVTD